ncbi:dihydroxyacetone kinase transcriptional activator DhaS [Caproiciproducens sp.]|uniref:dihydroxyacetone kinase transcriptional activator DhaS n=1 Tax=Caproiciproducens sp. TaxID=1954376 RepID=UPI00289B0754|nr:dihydroxyacetone kinase transcriptional activator DhaS [Caproiciproducens sp.]
MSDSLITKKAIAASIKELMKKRPLQKISVADIVEHCGINRQTFYYHFKDKYDLVDWIYYNEVVSAVTQNRSIEEWNNVVLDVLNTMKNEQYFYTNALCVTGQNAFQDYFFNVTKGMIGEMLETILQGSQIAPDDKDFIAEFYSYGLVGIVVQWARRGMKQPPEQIVQRLTHFIDDSKLYAAERYFKEHPAAAEEKANLTESN